MSSTQNIGLKPPLERDDATATASAQRRDADLGQPEPASAQPTKAAAASPARLHVVSARTHAPLAGAKVEFASSDGAHATIETDAEGIALLPHAGIYATRVSAADHLTCAGRLTMSSSATLALAEPDAGIVGLGF